MTEPRTITNDTPAIRYSLFVVLIRTLFSSLFALIICGLLFKLAGFDYFKAFLFALIATMFVFAPVSILFFATRAVPHKSTKQRG